MEDRSIILRCQAGEIELIDLLFNRYKDALYRFCFYLGKDRYSADELFQDTWLKVIDNIQSCDPHRSFRPWAFAIAANIYREKHRRYKRWLNLLRKHFPGVVEDFYSSPADDAELEEEQLLLHKCLQQLDDLYKLPLLLFYFKGNSQQEIAEILKVPVGTVKSRMHTGKQRLKKLLEVAESDR